ncbi:hypothetical protein DSO57_1021967 [Entomophthora muscae]|uniref:Uncharacterized protein n=1 Tax=Entomophthora muscae TaxID=34485 RepID=A0ACC2TQW3_9FUNG|nr:hypothetical protein DSO57_1021967 [Entomophthora muscae]
MQNWIAFSSTVPSSTEVLGPISPITSPVIPSADFSLSPLFTEEQVSPIRPRNVHGRMSVREAVKRAEAMKKQILDFQANLEEKPELRGAFQDSSQSAEKLLQGIKHFTRRFGN